MSPGGLRRLEGVCLGLAVIVGLLAARPSAEFSSHMAFDVAARMTAGPFARVYLPEGLDTETFRPISILLVRLMAAWGSPLHPWIGLCKGLSVPIFMGIVVIWGRARGLGAVGPIAGLATILTPAGLFNSWHLTEFDLIAAAFILGGEVLLLRARTLPGWRATVLAALPFVAAAWLKDSAGVLAVVVLGASWVDERRDGLGWRGPAARVGALVVMMLLGFFLLGPTPRPGGPGASILADLFLRAGAVVSVQWAALLSLPAALALGLARFGARLSTALGLGLVVAHLAVPDLAWSSLFLCMLTGRGLLAVLLGSALLIALLTHAAGPLSRDGKGLAASSFALAPVGAAIAFTLLPMLLRMRPDVSTRVFLPVLPGAFALVLGSAAALRPAWRLALAVPLLWALLAPGIRFGTEFLATERVEHAVKGELARSISGPTVVLGTHVVWEICARELEALAGRALPLQILRVHLPRGAGGPFVLQQTGADLDAARRAGVHLAAFTVATRSALQGTPSLAPGWDAGAAWLPSLAGGAVEDQARFYAGSDLEEAALQQEGGFQLGGRYVVRTALPAWSLHGFVQRAFAGVAPVEPVVISAAWWRR